MIRRNRSAASLPPPGLSGLNPLWSRLVTAKDSTGEDRTWHLLDSWADREEDSTFPAVTLLCVHGNPSWSYLWRHVLQRMPSSVRVIAVDQLDMGFSERTGIRRTLQMRIDDLCLLTDTLEVTGPVVTLAHDWGGPISMGWALRHHDVNVEEPPSSGLSKAYLAGIMLTNTAVHQPESASAPAVIRLIRFPALLRTLTVNTRAFINGAIRMSRPALSGPVREGLHAPYLTASRREAIADFVADIPLDQEHESASALNDVAAGLARLETVPALLVWGARDLVFNDRYLRDLESRLPHADVHRYPEAAHFVTEDEDVAAVALEWLSLRLNIVSEKNAHSSGSIDNEKQAAPVHVDESPTLRRRSLADFSVAEPDTVAVVEPGSDDRTISFGELAHQVETLAAGMALFGIKSGNRLAVMIMPGIDLSVVVYACWRLGVTLVLVDSGLGRKGMQRAMVGANPDYLIGIDKALVAARLLGWPGKRIALKPCSSLKMRALNITNDVASLMDLGKGRNAPPWPEPDVEAAIAFTSGSTGPSKGVVYLHRHVEAQRDALMKLYGISANDRLVAAFAPFALYGPTMGISSMVPDMDVTRPASLSAETLVSAVERIKATLVFASPAALVNVVATQQALTTDTITARSAVRVALSAGAPVRASLLNATTAVFPNASLHTPYGMTEVLPVADISLRQLEQIDLAKDSAEQGREGDEDMLRHAGVCVGAPLDSVHILIDPLDQMGKPIGSQSTQPDTLGEIIVRAHHIRHGYDRLWYLEHLASQPTGSHRTGDIGQLDSQGRLWIGGRLGHVVVTPDGPLAPVACEQIIETIDGVDMAAVVGVGPAGTQAAVAVVQASNGRYAVGGAPLELVDLIRHAVQPIADIAAVLVVRRLPVDRRHNSKVDRSAVAHWANGVLAGDSMKSL